MNWKRFKEYFIHSHVEIFLPIEEKMVGKDEENGGKWQWRRRSSNGDREETMKNIRK